MASLISADGWVMSNSQYLSAQREEAFVSPSGAAVSSSGSGAGSGMDFFVLRGLGDSPSAFFFAGLFQFRRARFK